ncbi:MAG: DUF898 domain-containing protein [Zoogloeaceae bacterium]|jgi:uncharacterized membrane protein YjgN (DUF898 family)|nr:DUF898 domain-containing protein [Zoogloeaceae bacterium]
MTVEQDPTAEQNASIPENPVPAGQDLNLEQNLPDEPTLPVEPALAQSLPVEPTPAPTFPVEKRLKFVGTGEEYFRIWIVNLMLSILTLGIYSAWAKVRREQYFHRNTLLDGSGFDYHGKPKAILVGRIIAFAMVVILAVIEKIKPELYHPALLLCSPLIPWFLVRSFAFRARNTSFRGLRFNFLGTYKGMCKAFLGYFIIFIALGWVMYYSMEQIAYKQATVEQTAKVDQSRDTADETDEDTDAAEATHEEMADDEDDEDYGEDDEAEVAHDETDADTEEAEGSLDPFRSVDEDADTEEARDFKLPWYWLFIAAFLCIPLLIPAFVCDFKRFQMGHFSFGTSGFRVQLRILSFYGLFLRALWPFLAFIVLLVAVIVGAGVLFGNTSILNQSGGVVISIILIIMVGIILFYGITLVTFPYLNALISNHVWNNTNLENHRFVSDQTFWGITAVVLTNWLLIALTLGLYWPWAKVRMAAYRASHTAVLMADDMDNFIAGATQEKSAIGEEVADIFDFDLAI